MSDNVCTVVINYQTPDLLQVAVESFRRFYKGTPLLIIDNGSRDQSKDVINNLARIAPQKTDVLFLETNIYHGPAMDRAINETNKEFVFFLDSDTETRQGGFLEAMYEKFQTSVQLYGVGRPLLVNKRGFYNPAGEQVLAPAYMMIRRSYYYKLPPFEHHGLPIMKNNLAARQKGYELQSFPIEEYIDHAWRGTASRFGYGLGWRGKLDYVLNKIGV